jgi:hypothetical protein
VIATGFGGDARRRARRSFVAPLPAVGGEQPPSPEEPLDVPSFLRDE